MRELERLWDLTHTPVSYRCDSKYKLYRVCKTSVQKCCYPLQISVAVQVIDMCRVWAAVALGSSAVLTACRLSIHCQEHG